MGLKENTSAAHTKAHQTAFAQEMMSGNMSEEKYKKYLWNAYISYDILEDIALSMGVYGPIQEGDHRPLDGIIRQDRILADFKELGGDTNNPPALVAAVNEFKSYIVSELQDDVDGLTAQSFAWHNHLLTSGAETKSKVPGSGTMYGFEDALGTVAEVEADMKLRLKDSMTAEATKGFEYIERMFEQLDA